MPAQSRYLRYSLLSMSWMALAAAIVTAPPAMSQDADIILHNGKILTVDQNFSIAQAIAIRGNRIAAVGSNQQVMALSGPNTKVLDLKGRTVVPGLIDTHLHINDNAETQYGMEIGYDGFLAYPIDWGAVRTTQDVLNQVKAHMEKYYKNKPGEWVYFASAGGSNDDSVKIMVDGLNRWELDKVSPDNPIVMGMTWPNVNGVVVNSKAMDILWAEHEAFFKKYGRYWVDQAGRPEGHLETPGLRFALEKLPEPPVEKMAQIFKKYAEELNAAGITGISTRLPQYAQSTFKYMDARGEMPLRLGYGLETVFGRTDLANGLKQVGAQMGAGSEKFWVISAAPSAIDGSGSRVCTAQPRLTAASLVEQWWPHGQCLQDVEYRGAKGAPITANYIRDWFVTTARDGVRLANTHAGGDRSVKMALNLFEELQQQYGTSAVNRWAFDHCRMVDPADLPRAGQLGVMFSCETSWGAGVERTYGEKVAHAFPSPFKTMINNGIIVSLEGGDTDEWGSIEAVITRKDREGKVWGPQERLTRQEALRTATIWAATYVLREKQIGSLETGKLADLVVVDKDYLTVPEDQIGDLVTQMTMLDGKIVFAHPQFAQEYSLSGPGMIVATLKDLQARRKPSSVSRR